VFCSGDENISTTTATKHKTQHTCRWIQKTVKTINSKNKNMKGNTVSHKREKREERRKFNQ
jgi:hypothetical protein